MKKIGVIGTRRRNSNKDFNLIREMIYKYYAEGDWLVSGGCKTGADSFAESIAKSDGMPILTFYPNYKKYGSPAALFIRNSHVAETSDLIIACVVHPEEGTEEVLKRSTGGTEDTLRKFRKSSPFGDIILV
jgi:hypothetical protein